MCGAVMRGPVALPGSEATSRQKGTRRNLGDLVWPAVAGAIPGRDRKSKAKLSGNRRGVGWVHSTGETLEQSRAERWRRGRREGTQPEEEVDAEARPGHSAGFGVSQEAPIRGSYRNGPPKPRTSITLTSDKSPVRESRTPGSEGEVPGNRHLYLTSPASAGSS